MLNSAMRGFANLTVTMRSISKRQTKILVSIAPIFNRKYTTKSKIIVEKPIVEIGGDEMSKIVFDKIKQKLIIPYVNLERDYYDCSIENRKLTNNEVLKEATAAILKFNVGIKCSIKSSDESENSDTTPTKKMWPASTTISSIQRALRGTVFHESIICSNITNKWRKPIVVCRHISDQDVVSSHQNPSLESITAFAESCFQTALERNFPLVSSLKFRESEEIFLQLYTTKFKRLFDKANLVYECRGIDEMTAFCEKTKGGFVWAMGQQDRLLGDFFGSLAMMMHSLRSHDGKTVLTEPAHGSISKHYKRHLKGKQTSTNPVSSIFAWSRGLQHRAKLDCNYDLLEFAELLEQCSVATVEEGNLTRDLAYAVYGSNFQEDQCVTTNQFIENVARRVDLNITKIFPREELESVN